MMRGLVLIMGSVHDVSERIHEIDDRYVVYYNMRKYRYEVHSRGFSPSLQLVLPYHQLDSRSVDYVSLTRVARKFDEIKRIDDDNERLVASRASAILDKMEYKTRSLMSYISGGGDDVPAYEEI